VAAHLAVALAAAAFALSTWTLACAWRSAASRLYSSRDVQG